MPDRKKHIATRPITRPQRKIITTGRCALALARRGHLSYCRRLPMMAPLPIALRLLPSPLLAVLGGPIALTRPPTPPALSRLPTRFTAIVGLRMTWREKLFAALEQTAPQPIRATPWPLAEVLGKMTLVHGRLLLPLFKSRSEASTSLRGASYRSLLLINFRRHLVYEVCQSRDPITAHWPGPPRAFGPLPERC
jgi:hypothetical protein